MTRFFAASLTAHLLFALLLLAGTFGLGRMKPAVEPREQPAVEVVMQEGTAGDKETTPAAEAAEPSPPTPPPVQEVPKRELPPEPVKPPEPQAAPAPDLCSQVNRWCQRRLFATTHIGLQSLLYVP